MHGDAPGWPALNVLIVDDEPLARMRLRALLQALDEWPLQVVGEAGDGHQALDLLRTQACDAVLLDIRMPGLDGLALAAALRARPTAPAVVFVTAFGEHALDAFDVQAVDYLTKPVQRARLAEAMRRVQERRAARGLPPGDARPAAADRSLTVTERSRTLRIPPQEIVLARADHKQVVLHTLTRQHVIDLSLNELAVRLGPGFIRVHRNALVARSAVRELQRRAGSDDDDGGWAVRLEPGALWVPVSRRQLAELRDALRP